MTIIVVPARNLERLRTSLLTSIRLADLLDRTAVAAITHTALLQLDSDVDAEHRLALSPPPADESDLIVIIQTDVTR